MRSARPRLAAALAATLLLSACARSVVVDAAPGAPPYEGPLHVAVTAAPDDEEADRSGAAGLVVHCDTPVTGYSELEPYQGGPVSRSPGRALRRELEDHPTRGVRSGLREARREQDRVLYTYEADRRVRQALVVHRGKALDGGTGWYVESWARCDWAELPPHLADDLGMQIWTDAAGRRVATDAVVSGRGPEHCDWQHMRFLDVDGGELDGGQTYVERPDPTYYPDYFSVPYASAVPLPADARDSGFEHDGRHLWLAPDQSRAYVGTSTSVAVWPATVQPFACA